MNNVLPKPGWWSFLENVIKVPKASKVFRNEDIYNKTNTGDDLSSKSDIRKVEQHGVYYKLCSTHL